MSAPALTRPTAPPRSADPNAGLPANALGKEKGVLEQVVLYVFVVVPFLALAPIVPAVWGWGLSWLDVGLAVGFYFVTLLGVTVGYHRYFTHGSFKANRPLRIALAAVGGWRSRARCPLGRRPPPAPRVLRPRGRPALAVAVRHRRPRWPRACGTRTWAGCSTAGQTNAERFAPDLLKDNAVRRTSRLFSLWASSAFALPAVIGGLVTMSWAGAWSAFFWAGLVRVALLHHVTWSVNSVCHVVGNRPVRLAATGRRTSGRWRS